MCALGPICLAATLAACASTPPDGQPSSGLPVDVQRFVDRRMQCDHWAGEEPYDADRRRQIDAAIRDLRCDRIEADDRRLAARYPDRPDVQQALDGARAGDW